MNTFLLKKCPQGACNDYIGHQDNCPQRLTMHCALCGKRFTPKTYQFRGINVEYEVTDNGKEIVYEPCNC